MIRFVPLLGFLIGLVSELLKGRLGLGAPRERRNTL